VCFRLGCISRDIKGRIRVTATHGWSVPALRVLRKDEIYSLERVERVLDFSCTRPYEQSTNAGCHSHVLDSYRRYSSPKRLLEDLRLFSGAQELVTRIEEKKDDQWNDLAPGDHQAAIGQATEEIYGIYGIAKSRIETCGHQRLGFGKDGKRLAKLEPRRKPYGTPMAAVAWTACPGRFARFSRLRKTEWEAGDTRAWILQRLQAAHSGSAMGCENAGGLAGSATPGNNRAPSVVFP
jgi:hypothetical protein